MKLEGCGAGTGPILQPLRRLQRGRFLVVAVSVDQRCRLLRRLWQTLSDCTAIGLSANRAGKQADNGQHDQADALLTVIGAVREADAGAGEDQDAAHPPDRRLVAGRLVEMLVVREPAQPEIKRAGQQ